VGDRAGRTQLFGRGKGDGGKLATLEEGKFSTKKEKKSVVKKKSDLLRIADVSPKTRPKEGEGLHKKQGEWRGVRGWESRKTPFPRANNEE